MRPVVLLLALAGCAPATIDTVQPNALDASVLEGEWMLLETVMDVPYGTAATFVGAQGSLERVRFEAEENLLVGRRSYDHVAEVGDVEQGGAPLVAWRITDRFDIRRAYDPRTGEETNVVLENRERPWNERQYLRLDWSANLAATGTTELAGADVALTEIPGSVPGDAWAPRFDDSDGDGTIDHVRLFRKVVVQPDSTRIEGYGELPTCWFFGQAVHDCAPSEVIVGTTLRRVDADDAYVGQAWSDRWTSTFGVFQTERLHFDRRYGVTEPDHAYWANRHDLWVDALQRDDAGAPLCRVGDTKVRCEDAPVADATPLLKPADEREVRPIVYHVGPDFDPTLADTLPRIEAEWNAPLAATVNQLRFWACLDRKGTRPKDCRPELEVDRQVFVLCPHNPSQPGDPEVCSTDHTGPEHRPDGVPDLVLPGDLRYSLLNVVGTPQLASPFGYGPSAADPVGAELAAADGSLELGPGRIVAANAHVYAHALDRIATSTADLVRLIDGDLTDAELVDGENVRAWVEELRAHGTTVGLVDGAADGGGAAAEVPAAQALAAMDGSWALPLQGQLPPPPEHPSAFRAWKQQVDRVIDRSGLAASSPLAARAAWERLVDSPFDEALWDDEAVATLGLDPDKAAVMPDLLAGRSPLQALDPADAAAQEDGWAVAGRHALDLDDGSYTNPSLLGLARRLADEGLDHEQIRDRIRDELFVSVSLHEIGHTLGLRHNFAGSVDAWNFHPDYWKLRDDGDMGPRHVDPETQAEIDGGLDELAYSSVMDYHANRNGDWHGLGRWDHAVVKFAYGQLVEVMTELKDAPVLSGFDNRDAVGVIAYFDQSSVYPAPLLSTSSGGFQRLHYTDFPRVADLQARVDVPFDRLVPELPPDDGVPGFDAFLTVADDIPGVVQRGLPAAPYRFCSDELAVGVMCSRFDEGADPYEIQTALTRDYQDRYLLENFARRRYGFGWGNYAGDLYARTFRPLQTWVRYYALFHAILGAESDPKAAAYLADDRGLGGWTVASDDAFRFLVRVLTRPEPGAYGPATRPDGVTLHREGADDVDFTVPLGQGAWYDSEWDADGGYHWFERRERIGTYWDRMLALQVLAETSPYDFVGFDTASDPRAYALGFDRLWRDDVHRVLGALVADDALALAPLHEADGRLTWPDPTAAVWPPPGREADAVEPATWWLVRYGAGLMGAALLQEGYDRTWLARARVYEEGSGDARTPPPGRQVVSFHDPFGGATWSAWREPGRDGEELSVGARLLDQANRLAARCGDGADPVACEALRQAANDVGLQARIVQWFERAGG